MKISETLHSNKFIFRGRGVLSYLYYQKSSHYNDFQTMVFYNIAELLC